MNHQTAEKPWLNSETPIAQRVELLLNAMGPEEKIGQMWQVAGDLKDRDQLIKDGKIGSILNLGFEHITEAQKIAVYQTRLGIPLIIGRDVIHGFRTIFPIPLGQAATFNPDLVRQGSRVAAREASSQGIHWTFAPMVDICRDPRWGRIAESYGEDPYLASVLGAASVAGFQGEDPRAADSIAACAKHFAGYGAAEGGRDYNTTLIPESELRNVYLPPFKACLDAGCLTFMSGFNDLNGVPATGHRFLLTDILRTEWGFPGCVVSDWASVEEMINHGFAADTQAAASLALQAGVDMEMASATYHHHLPKLLQDHPTLSEKIDQAVRHVLHLKFSLGLFEDPFSWEKVTDSLLCSSHLQLAKQAATESCVLLKNEGVLPLQPSPGTSLAVVGPLADAPAEQIGCWVFDGLSQDAITPLRALQQTFGDSCQINYAPGLETSRSTDTRGFTRAIQAAENSDLVLCFLGEEAILSGEAHSRAFLNPPGAQEELLAALAETGKPIVLIIMAGRPLLLSKVLPHCQTLLYAWHPGTMGGPAIVDLLLGRFSPSGKLPVSFPSTEGQIPVYYNKRNTGRPPRDVQRGIPEGTPLDPVDFCANYIDSEHLPLFPFGFGLSYSSFELGQPVLESQTIHCEDQLKVCIQISNTGEFAATEVVQLYLRDLAASLTRPVRELKGFQRVTLQPGESRAVTFALPARQLAFYDGSGNHLLEPGEFDLWVSSDSKSGQPVRFRLVQ
ncbi:MAG: beta-glucosidase BglX [Puniceicoccaceae bacterium]